MRKIVIIVTAVFFLLLDQTVMPFLAIYGSYPSLLFTFFALFSLRSDYEDAILIALVTGLLQDLYFPYGFGLHTLLNLFLFLILTKIGRTLKEGKKILPVFLVAVAQTLKGVVFLLILGILGISGNYISVVVIPLYSIVLSLLLYKGVYSFERIPVIKKEWKF